MRSKEEINTGSVRKYQEENVRVCVFVCVCILIKYSSISLIKTWMYQIGMYLNVQQS